MPLYFMGTLITLMSIAIPYHIFLSPQIAFEAGLTNEEPPLCRKESPFEAHGRYQKNNADAGKAARFSRREGYLCSRSLFDRTERHTSYDFILRRSHKLISDVTNRAAKKTEKLPEHENFLWMIRLRDSIPTELKPAFEATALESLVSALGIQKVSRRKTPYPNDDNGPQAILTLGLRPVVDEDLMIEADLSVTSLQKTLTWNIQ